MTDYELLRLRVRLTMAREIERDFRPNTTIANIIQQYESIIKNKET